MNTSTTANPSNTTVSRSEFRILKKRSSIGKLSFLHELHKCLLLFFRDLFVAHEFEKPCFALMWNDSSNDPVFLAIFRVHPAHIHQGSFGARQVEGCHVRDELRLYEFFEA